MPQLSRHREHRRAHQPVMPGHDQVFEHGHAGERARDLVRAHQPAALQRRHEAFGDFAQVAAGDAHQRRDDQRVARRARTVFRRDNGRCDQADLTLFTAAKAGGGRTDRQ